MYKRALELAKKAYAGQTDKTEDPYINHLLAVANSFKDKDETLKTITLLYGIVDDRKCSIHDLQDMDFTSDIIKAVTCLTKLENEDYLDYLTRISSNNFARRVKIVDLKHSLDLTKLMEITEKDLRHVEIHTLALDYLKALSNIDLKSENAYIRNKGNYKVGQCRIALRISLEKDSEHSRYTRIGKGVASVDGWELQCCPNPFAVGDWVEWLISKSTKDWIYRDDVEKIDFIYDEHSMYEWGEKFILVGKVTNIKACYSLKANDEYGKQQKGKIIDVPDADGWDEDIGNQQFCTYVVCLDDVYIAPARKSDVWFG